MLYLFVSAVPGVAVGAVVVIYFSTGDFFANSSSSSSSSIADFFNTFGAIVCGFAD